MKQPWPEPKDERPRNRLFLVEITTTAPEHQDERQADLLMRELHNSHGKGARAWAIRPGGDLSDYCYAMRKAHIEATELRYTP